MDDKYKTHKPKCAWGMEYDEPCFCGAEPPTPSPDTVATPEDLELVANAYRLTGDASSYYACFIGETTDRVDALASHLRRIESQKEKLSAILYHVDRQTILEPQVYLELAYALRPLLNPKGGK